MTSVQSFGTSLLTPQVKTQDNTQAPSVEEVLNNTPPAPIPEQAPDTFTKSDTPQNPQPQKKSSLLRNAIIGAAFVVVAFFAGRAGWFGKYVKGLFRGKLSAKDMNKKIEEKMAEYLNLDKDKVKIVQNSDGTQTLQAELKSGSKKEYAITDGKNVVRLKRDYENCNLNEEYIFFDKKTGAPKLRIDQSRQPDKKVSYYRVFKGDDAVKYDNESSSGIFQETSKSDIKRRFLGLFGRKQMTIETSTYNNPETGNPNKSITTIIYRRGKKSEIRQAKEGKERTIYIGENGKVSSIRTETQDGKVAIEKFQYTTTPEGKIKKDKVYITDEAGNATAPIKWRD